MNWEEKGYLQELIINLWTFIKKKLIPKQKWKSKDGLIYLSIYNSCGVKEIELQKL